MSSRDLFYIGLLIIVTIIAFYVNRKRDAKGRISFIDKNKMGVTGIIIHALEGDDKIGSWFLPLWHPINRLILEISILLPAGDYGVEAYWENFIHKPLLELFEREPANLHQHYEPLSEIRQFSLAKHLKVQLLLQVSGKRLTIDSPAIKAETKDNLVFPILINDPDLNKTAIRLSKDRNRKKREIVELPVVDEKISGQVYEEMKILQRKIDNVIIQNNELQSDLHRAVQQHKANS